MPWCWPAPRYPPAKRTWLPALLNSLLGAEATPWRRSPLPSLVLASPRSAGSWRKRPEGLLPRAIFWGVNPAYSFPLPDLWKVAAAKIRSRPDRPHTRSETAIGTAMSSFQ